jgi:hypothetical protein
MLPSDIDVSTISHETASVIIGFAIGAVELCDSGIFLSAFMSHSTSSPLRHISVPFDFLMQSLSICISFTSTVLMVPPDAKSSFVLICLVHISSKYP